MRDRAPLPVELPDHQWPELAKAADSLNALLTEQRLTGLRLGNLADGRLRAVDGDNRSFAQAIREDKPDPGTKRTEKVDREIVGCNRRMEALAVAVAEAQAELEALVAANRDRWLLDAENEVQTERHHYRETVEAMLGQRAKVQERVALARWLREHPRRSFGTYLPPLPSLRGMNGDPYPWDAVCAALLADAEPTPAPQAVPVRNAWPAQGLVTQQ